MNVFLRNSKNKKSESSANMPTAHMFVAGKVQGVFYRKNTHEQAVALKLTGWVKNLDDGRVEIVAQGPKEQLEKLHMWCKVGPKKAKVTSVEVELSESDEPKFSSFVVDRE